MKTSTMNKSVLTQEQKREIALRAELESTLQIKKQLNAKIEFLTKQLKKFKGYEFSD